MNDLISRQAAIDAIEKLILPQTKGETAAEEINRVAWRCAINCAEEMIGHLPTIDPVKRGKWIPRIATGNIALIECSECQFHYPELLGAFSFYYCPHCGAKMERSEE